MLKIKTPEKLILILNILSLKNMLLPVGSNGLQLPNNLGILLSELPLMMKQLTRMLPYLETEIYAYGLDLVAVEFTHSAHIPTLI